MLCTALKATAYLPNFNSKVKTVVKVFEHNDIKNEIWLQFVTSNTWWSRGSDNRCKIGLFRLELRPS